jgi:hypothetical protein
MANDLETPEKRRKAKREIQMLMLDHLESATALFEGLRSDQRRISLHNIYALRSIKRSIEKRADTLGHSRACKGALPICRGACCQWHFPRALTPVDFLIPLFCLTREKRMQLTRLLSDFSNTAYQCPLLLETGCFFSFRARPIACTNAYPCVSGEKFRAFRENQRPGIKKIYNALNDLFRQ